MGNADGAIIIETEIDQRGAIKGVAELKVILGGAGKQFEQTVDSLTSSLEGMNMKVNADAAEEQIDAVTAQAEELKAELEEGPRIHLYNSDTESEIEEIVEDVREATEQVQQVVETTTEETAQDSRSIFQRAIDGFQSAYQKFVSALTLPGTKESGDIPELDIETDDARDKIVELTGRIEMLKQRLKEMEGNGKTFGFEDYDKTVQELQQAEQSLKAYKKSLNTTTTATVKLNKATKDTNKAVNKSGFNFKGALKKILAYGFGIRSLYMLFRKLRTAIGEGIKNVVQVDGATNAALSGLMSSLTAVKNALGAAFAPIITVIAPYITRLIDLLTAAINKLGQFFSALSGKGTFTKAVKVQQDYAKSLNSTADSAKKASKALYGFDELNVLQKDESTAGVSPTDMFKTEDIEPQVLGFADRIMQKFAELKESITGWWGGLDFGPLESSFDNLKGKVAGLVSIISDGLKWSLDNVLLPIGTWTIQDGLPVAFNTWATAIEAVNTAFAKLQPGLQSIYDNILVPIGQFVGGAIVSAFQYLQEVWQQVSATIEEHSESINLIIIALTSAVKMIISVVRTVVSAIMAQIRTLLVYIIRIVGDITQVLGGIIKFVKGIFTGDLKMALEGIKDIVKGVFNGIIDMFEGVINTIIDGLNSIQVDIPDWVPFFGGEHFGLNFNHVSIPRLATGTVVPRSAGEFAAILGDNNRETEVVSPLSTMKQAFMEALDARGGQEVNVYISAEGDMDALVRELNFRISKEQSRVGTNFTKVVRA